ncbi:MAG TPA: holo-ACP synthase [Burkholderiaceae bacterium]|nr:holo-ACP synthase [Burkholderiaceae bacterium]
MIYGIGTDVLEIARLEETLRRTGPRFAERVLGAQELEKYRQRALRNAERGLKFLATRFAAKEAVSKALGLGMRHPMTWRAAEILNAPSGKPIVVTHGALHDFVVARRLKLHVSVTDERAYAMAYAIAEIFEGDG